MTSQTWRNSTPFSPARWPRTRSTQAGINLMQFCFVLDLNPKMVEARFATAC